MTLLQPLPSIASEARSWETTSCETNSWDRVCVILGLSDKPVAAHDGHASTGLAVDGLAIDVHLFPDYRLQWREMRKSEVSRVFEGDLFHYQWDAHQEHLRILAPAHLVERIGEETGVKLRRPLDEQELTDALARQIALGLLHECEDDFKHGQAFVDALGVALVTRLLRTYKEKKSMFSESQHLNNVVIQRVRAFIEAHLGEDIGLSEMANVAGLSLCYFARCFHATTGMTPHEFLTQQRILRAISLLLTSTEPIVGVAAQCGFSDQSHLNRHLRRQLGITAGQLRPRASASPRRAYKP